MKERLAEIATPDGRMEAFVTHPEEGGPCPAVIVCMDVFGPREELYDVARRIAVAGYYAMVPDFYYRNGKLRVTIPSKRPWAIADLDKAQEQRARAAGKETSNAMAMRDVAAMLKFMEKEPVKPGPKGVIGFCMGGRFALCAAVHFPDQFRATAGIHPSSLVSDNPESPHLMAHQGRTCDKAGQRRSIFLPVSLVRQPFLGHLSPIAQGDPGQAVTAYGLIRELSAAEGAMTVF